MKVLMPLVERIEADVMASDLLHADDTPIRVLDRSLKDRGLGKGVSGVVHVSGTLDAQTRDCLGLSRAIGEGVGTFSDTQDAYLSYHRDSVFLA